MQTDRRFPPFPFLISGAVGTAVGWQLFGVNKYYAYFFATIIATVALGFFAKRAATILSRAFRSTPHRISELAVGLVGIGVASMSLIALTRSEDLVFLSATAAFGITGVYFVLPSRSHIHMAAMSGSWFLASVCFYRQQGGVAFLLTAAICGAAFAASLARSLGRGGSGSRLNGLVRPRPK